MKTEDKMIKEISCKIGLHWPLNRITKAFVDRVIHKQVYVCQCNCGQHWMATGRYSLDSRMKITKEDAYSWKVDLRGYPAPFGETYEQ
jgi:hypothetical protein